MTGRGRRRRGRERGARGAAGVVTVGRARPGPRATAPGDRRVRATTAARTAAGGRATGTGTGRGASRRARWTCPPGRRAPRRPGRLEPSVGAGTDGRGPVEVPGERREARPQQPLRRLAQVVAPRDRGAHGPVPRWPATPVAAHRGRLVVEQGFQVGHGHVAQPQDGQLDRQRDTPDLAAHPRRRLLVVSRQPEPGNGGGCPFLEERDRVGAGGTARRPLLRNG